MMGLDPAVLGRLGFWQYWLCVQGWNAAHETEEAVEPPTAAEFHDLVARFGGLN